MAGNSPQPTPAIKLHTLNGLLLLLPRSLCKVVMLLQVKSLKFSHFSTLTVLYPVICTGSHSFSSIIPAPSAPQKVHVAWTVPMCLLCVCVCLLCSVGVWAQKVCGMDCSGRLGVPPTLYCDMCMALFHPECVGFSYLGRHVGFLCMVC